MNRKCLLSHGFSEDEFDLLVRHAAEECGLGPVRGWSLITTGFEDCNSLLYTRGGTFLVKVFAPHRTAAEPARIRDVLLAVLAAGVRHPRLHGGRDGQIVHREPHSGRRFLVMDAVDGTDYYRVGRPPGRGELTRVMEQLTLVHTVRINPGPMPHPWAVTNIATLLTRVDPFLTPDQRRLAGRAAEAIHEVDRSTLPHTLIHADLTKGNAMLDQSGAVWLIDFSVATRAPRIQDLAVLAANLLHGSDAPLPERVMAAADLYSQANTGQPLTDHELRLLPVFTFAAAAMELLGALDQVHLQGNHSSEAEYLVELGHTGLTDFRGRLRDCGDAPRSPH